MTRKNIVCINCLPRKNIVCINTRQTHTSIFSYNTVVASELHHRHTTHTILFPKSLIEFAGGNFTDGDGATVHLLEVREVLLIFIRLALDGLHEHLLVDVLLAA